MLLSDAPRSLDEAIDAARSLSHELVPPVLHRSGLPAALAWLANWTREKYKLDVQVVADPRADSSRSDLRTLLYESTQFFVVGEASDGIESIAQARRLRPDVILMDVMMPHMDGIEATKRIHAELPDIQILGLSTQPRSETLHAIEHAGAAGFFVKGLDTQRLLDRLLALHVLRAVAAP